MVGNEEDELLLKKCNFYLKEEPKISNAIQTFFADELAKSQVNESGLFGLKDSLYSHQTTQVGLVAIRKILSSINNLQLKPPHVWGVENPQKEEESGLDRMDAIANYKVIYTIFKTVRGKNEKITKLLGLQYLKQVWVYVKASVVQEMTGKNEWNLVNACLLRFEDCLFFEERNLSHKEEYKLVWAKDINVVLREKSEKRKLEVKKRLDEQEEIAKQSITAQLSSPTITQEEEEEEN